MSVYEARRTYYRTIPETVSNFVVPSFPTSTQINPTLLLHLTGANGLTSFPDATGRHTVVAVPNVHIDTSQSIFSGGSALFDGVGGNLFLSGSTDLGFSTNDFTIDTWIRPQSTGLTQCIINFDFATNPNLEIFFNADGTLKLWSAGGNRIVSPAGAVQYGVWQHVALTRASLISRLFVGGFQVGSNYFDTSNYTQLANQPTIGNDGVPDFYSGYMQELRIINGRAAWITAFTPPAAPYMVS